MKPLHLDYIHVIFQMDLEKRNTELQGLLTRLETELGQEKSRLKKMRSNLSVTTTSQTSNQATVAKLQEQFDRLQVYRMGCDN